MEMAMLMAGGLRREYGTLPWTHGAGADGLVRLAVALLAVAGMVMTLETRSLHWLWAVLA